MKITEIKCFVAAAKTENFTNASIILNITQSALSRQISNLETDLGVELFERVGKRVRLTKSGEALLPQAKEILASTSEFQALAKRLRSDPSSGSISIGSVYPLSSLFLPKLHNHISRNHPNIHLRFVEGWTFELIDKIVSGDLNMAVMFELPCCERLECIPLFSSDLFIVHSPKFRCELSDGCELRDALQLPLVTPSGDTAERQLFQQWAKDYNVAMNVISETNSYDLEFKLLLEGRGCLMTLLPGIDKDFHRHGLQYHRIADAKVNWILAMRPGEARNFSKLIEIVVSELREFYACAEPASAF